jgi:hypothetical protein
MGSKCSRGLRFAFKELDVKTKPFLQLSNCEDAALLANALTITQCVCGQIQGCKTSSICTSIADLIKWHDASLFPNLNTGRAVNLLRCPVCVGSVCDDCIGPGCEFHGCPECEPPDDPPPPVIDFICDEGSSL